LTIADVALECGLSEKQVERKLMFENMTIDQLLNAYANTIDF
jgi:hypothetical protein